MCLLVYVLFRALTGNPTSITKGIIVAVSHRVQVQKSNKRSLGTQGYREGGGEEESRLARGLFTECRITSGQSQGEIDEA